MEKKFIKTNDLETKEQLLKLGFTLIKQDGNLSTFINDLSKPMNFDKQKIAYSNIIAM